jgi:hypothetical protein
MLITDIASMFYLFYFGAPRIDSDFRRTVGQLWKARLWLVMNRCAVDTRALTNSGHYLTGPVLHYHHNQWSHTRTHKWTGGIEKINGRANWQRCTHAAVEQARKSNKMAASESDRSGAKMKRDLRKKETTLWWSVRHVVWAIAVQEDDEERERERERWKRTGSEGSHASRRLLALTLKSDGRFKYDSSSG